MKSGPGSKEVRRDNGYGKSGPGGLSRADGHRRGSQPHTHAGVPRRVGRVHRMEDSELVHGGRRARGTGRELPTATSTGRSGSRRPPVPAHECGLVRRDRADHALLLGVVLDVESRQRDRGSRDLAHGLLSDRRRALRSRRAVHRPPSLERLPPTRRSRPGQSFGARPSTLAIRPVASQFRSVFGRMRSCRMPSAKPHRYGGTGSPGSVPRIRALEES